MFGPTRALGADIPMTNCRGHASSDQPIEYADAPDGGPRPVRPPCQPSLVKSTRPSRSRKSRPSLIRPGKKFTDRTIFGA